MSLGLIIVTLMVAKSPGAPASLLSLWSLETILSKLGPGNDSVSVTIVADGSRLVPGPHLMSCVLLTLMFISFSSNEKYPVPKYGI